VENDKKYLINVSSEEAREYFLQSSNYFSLKLPSYFDVNYLLEYAESHLGTRNLAAQNFLFEEKKYSKISDINYLLMQNKNSLSYRPFKLIHPLLYLDFVNYITKKDNWEIIQKRFNELRVKIGTKIECKSYQYLKNTSNKNLSLALEFWKEIEQVSIKLSLNYNYLLQTDISDFYSRIYTHTIPWAMANEKTAKSDKLNTFNKNETIKQKLYLWGRIKKNNVTDFMITGNYFLQSKEDINQIIIDNIKGLMLSSLLEIQEKWINTYLKTRLIKKMLKIGNDCDSKFQQMNYNETVGIPQGNALSDFFAEMLLTYIDMLLVQKIADIEPNLEYRILRYRDDYRIFTLTEEDAHLIKKELVLLLQRHKLSINEKKTIITADIITNSMKPEKIYWIENDPVIRSNNLKNKYLYKVSIQKHLLLIRIFAEKYPNNGQLIRALNEFADRITGLNVEDFENNGTNITVLIAILIDILKKNPKMTDSIVILLSILIEKIDYEVKYDEFLKPIENENIHNYELDDKQNKINVVNALIKKLTKNENNSYLEIWLQRIIVKFIKDNNTSNNKTYKKQSTDVLVRVVNDIIEKSKTNEMIFNEVWLKEQYRIDLNEFIKLDKIDELDAVVKKEEIQNMEYLL
jgi:magnesium/nickel/cobalt transporter corA